MHISKYLLVIYISLLMFTACKKDFLEVTDNSTLNRQGYVKDLSTMREFMRGIYLMLSTKYAQGQDEAYCGLVSDELKVSTSGRALALHNNWSQIVDPVRATNTVSMNASWLNYYNIIRACSFVIEDIDKYSAEDNVVASDIKGQAYAIRALLHLRLVNIFAQHYSFTSDASHPGVPYITTSDISKPFSRQSVSGVFKNLISDLETGISLMSAKTDTRYMNASAAKGLLMRVLLYKEDFTKAKQIAVELISDFPLMSIGLGYPNDIFKFKADPSQTEVLFQLTPVNQSNALGQFFGLYARANHYLATSDLAVLLKENSRDVRTGWVNNTSNGWQIVKFPSGIAGGLGYTGNTDYYVPVVRSSEAFLTASEACFILNDETNARHYLDAIRKRANPNATNIMATGPALLDSICKERRKELSFEGFRMWDLQRWKQGVQRNDVFAGYQTTLPYPNSKAISPIPGQDVTMMGLKQNPEY